MALVFSFNPISVCELFAKTYELTLFPIVRKSGESLFGNLLPFPWEHLFQTALFEPFQFLDFALLQFDGLVLRGEDFGNLLLLFEQRHCKRSFHPVLRFEQ